MKHQNGFIKWEIHRNNSNSYTDIVYWESQSDAKRAEKEMANIPYANEWFTYFKSGFINNINLNKVGEFS